MYRHRILTARLERLFATFPVVVLTGARQVGKSTLLAHTLGRTLDTVVFDPVADVGNARQDPELFLRNHPAPIILDEIQYAPELIPVIKRLVDQDRRPGRYLLTGSQQWGVLRSVAESLAGRAVFLDLEGFSLAEAVAAGDNDNALWLGRWLAGAESFFRAGVQRFVTGITLYEQIWRGFLPEAQTIPLDTVPDYYAAYQRTSVERDARLLADVSDWRLFGRFVQLVAAMTAQEINASQLGRELGLTPQTARRWLDILLATFQWHEVPAFAGNALKRFSGKAKGYIADTGLACAAQAISTPRAIGGHPLWGRLFETACVAEIRKQCSFMSPPPKLFHWRAYSGAEVDIILEYDGVLYPLEIKAASRVSRRDASGISAFRQQHPNRRIAPGLILAPLEKALQVTEQDYALPWDMTGG